MDALDPRWDFPSPFYGYWYRLIAKYYAVGKWFHWLYAPTIPVFLFVVDDVENNEEEVGGEALKTKTLRIIVWNNKENHGDDVKYTAVLRTFVCKVIKRHCELLRISMPFVSSVFERGI